MHHHHQFAQALSMEPAVHMRAAESSRKAGKEARRLRRVARSDSLRTATITHNTAQIFAKRERSEL